MTAGGTMLVIANLVSVVFTLIWLLVLAHVIVSWFLSPYNEIRRTIDAIVQPLLAPIRRIMPPTAGIDFSPLVLLIVLDIIRRLLLGVLNRLA